MSAGITSVLSPVEAERRRRADCHLALACLARGNLQLATASQDGVGRAPKLCREGMVGLGAEELLFLHCPGKRDGAVVKEAQADAAMADGFQRACSAARGFFRWQSADEFVFFRRPRSVATLYRGDAQVATGVFDRLHRMARALGDFVVG